MKVKMNMQQARENFCKVLSLIRSIFRDHDDLLHYLGYSVNSGSSSPVVLKNFINKNGKVKDVA